MLLTSLLLSFACAQSAPAPSQFAVWPYGSDVQFRDALIARGRMFDDLGGFLIGEPDPALAGRFGIATDILDPLATDEALFVAIGPDHAEEMSNPSAESGRVLWVSPDARVTLFAAPKTALAALHGAGFRCHGAGRILNAARPIAPRGAFSAPGGRRQNAINPDPEIQGWVAQVSQANLQADVQTMVNFGTRRHEQPGEVACENWLEAEFAALGLNVSTYGYDAGADVVIGELPGVKDPSQIVVIGGHYDSINFATVTGDAPGADDDASGVAAVLEIARILSAQEFDFTIRFCGWSGEEFGLLGSEAYAAHLDNINADVVAMLQLDMIAYRANGDVRSVDFVTNDTDPGLTAFSQDVYAAYVPTLIVNSGILFAGTSDHRSFFVHGFPACFPFEDLNQFSPFIHTINDVIGTSANDWLRAELITEGALATVAEVARPASLEIVHTPLPDTQDEVGPYALSATVTALGGATTTSVDLIWRLAGGAWNTVAMTAGGGANQWNGTIPGQAAPARVEYHLIGTASNGRQAWSPEGFTPGENNHAFLVGVFTSIYANGFEGVTDEGWTHVQVATQDDWQRGTPAGKAGDPNVAASGAKCWGNDLGGTGFNGEYQPNVHNYLRSPVIDCTGQTDVSLRFQRWLTVEEGQFDDAKVEINGVVVWQNPVSGNLIDSSWTELDLDISQWADNNPSVQITFRLQSDGGLQFGGWNVDDVEVYVLASGGGTGTNTIVLAGPTTVNAGSSPTWTFSAAPASAPYWFINGTSGAGTTYQGHAFDVGVPVTVLASGTTSATGTGSVTIAVPPAAAGRTGYFEVAALAAGAWKDSNLLIVSVL
jgi:leucyl aminopeptidase